nr:hypothetical protein [Tanacetum cinerariifolium]
NQRTRVSHVDNLIRILIQFLTCSEFVRLSVPTADAYIAKKLATVEDFALLHEDKIYSESNTRYLQHEHYALWEVIKFGESYKAPPDETAKDKGLAGKVSSSTKNKGRTVAITAEDMQKRKNDVKARTTLLLALPDEHQLRFSKYDSAKELWEAILKTFGGNEPPKRQRRINDLNTMSLDDVYNHIKVYEPEVQTRAWSNSQNMAFISSSNTNSGKSKVPTIQGASTASAQVPTISIDVAAASLSYDTVCAFIATQPNRSQIKYEDISQIDDDDIEEIDIK